MYLLDTCFLSELKKKKPDANALDAYRQLTAHQSFVSVITLGEIAAGIETCTSAKRQHELTAWLDGLEERFAHNVLPITTSVMRRWAKVQAVLQAKGIALPVMDGLLAATALEHQLTIITRNIKDFLHTDTCLYNPWEAIDGR